MHEPRTVLRSSILACVLILLSGWLGMVAQPAEAQQTVTLSGRVTDAAGQAVSGAKLDLFRMPGRSWIDVQNTDGTGAYRFSVPPGTYVLQVVPPGPFISQSTEELQLLTNTTRTIVLETGVTLSGRVTGPAGQPVPWAWLNIHSGEYQEVGFGSANEAGYYSLGMPAGTYQIDVFSNDFLDKTVEGVAVPHDTVLNISLESGVVLAGRVVDDTGQPVPNAQVCAHLRIENRWFCTETESAGLFQLRVAPDAGYIVTVRPVTPLRPTRLRLEVAGEDVPDFVLTVSRQPMPFVPNDPPKAARISISTPTADGEVTVTGAAGAVAPSSAVVAITLETRYFTIAQATDDGSFTATLLAPPGTSILIKADPFGTSVAQIMNSAPLDRGRPIAALPGTIIRVADPPGAGIPIGGAGRVDGQLPIWSFHGSLNTQTLAPGDSLRVHGTVRVDSPALQGIDDLRVSVLLGLERAEGPSLLHGRFTAGTTLLTPTGLPIERVGLRWRTKLSQHREVPLVKTTATRTEAEIDLTLPLPPDLPAGHYRPFLDCWFPDTPTEDPASQPLIDSIGQDSGIVILPIITVGNPPPPRLDWMLLLDTLSNGSRGVVAGEDADHFGIAQRILTPSKTFVIPRLGASGHPLTYRLEPFVPTVSSDKSTNGVPPNVPRIPFEFPSGSLTVTIRHPDRTETVLGPAPFVQSRSKSLVDDEGNFLSQGGGHLKDIYQLSTLDSRFDVAFDQDGLHVITVAGTIDDIWGQTWTGGGTYEVHVGRVLALDTAVLPGTHFEVGDGFNPGLVVSPPMTAEVEVRLQHLPHSDVSQVQDRVIRGQTNRFGYFQPAGNSVIFEQPGEYRVDVTATGQDGQERLWMGSRTWGGVVAPGDPLIVAHGRRGIDAQDTIGPQWFFFDQLSRNDTTPHVPFPFQSGDVTWVEERGEVDSSLPLMSFHDPSRQLTALLQQRIDEYYPLQSPGNFMERVVVGEAPLFSSRPDGVDPYLDPTKVDLWAYSYRSVQRPLVRVREEIGEESVLSPYWRFDDRYADQIGVGAHGDLPGEFKFQYGAAVLHGARHSTDAHYAIYGSLFVLLP